LGYAQSSSISSAAKARRKQVLSEFESILSDIKAILVAAGVTAADAEKLPLKVHQTRFLHLIIYPLLSC
jgi:hypothetical protein